MKTQQSKILLVDDNEDDRLLMIRSIRRSDPETEVVALKDGLEALDYLSELSEEMSLEELAERRPGVVLLDINMPKVDGFEILERLRANPATKNLPVVVLSTSNDARDVARSYSLGANSFIRKPVDSKSFAETIAQLKSYWLDLNLGTSQPA